MPNVFRKNAMADSTEPTSDDGGWERRRQLSIEAHRRYLDELLAIRSEYPGMTDYAASKRAGATKGTMPWVWSAEGELCETINSMNAWGGALHSWKAWNRVVASYGDLDDRWTILSDQIEPLAFFCMLQPSCLADRIAVVAEALLHQANIAVSPGYKDRLDQDRGGLFRRKDRRAQLNRLGQPWMAYPVFGTALADMDGPTYRQLTRNFRDLSAHSFAPRLMIGEISRAIRKIVPWTDLVEQSDGTFVDVPHATRKMVQYGMSSIQPLPLEATLAANLAEYVKAQKTMAALAVLIDELCDCIDATPTSAPPPPSP
ncbi:hypothetical protein [Thermomonas paludicola]|uniref:hypothetical protein n=1 Tax=Thermomonas paludicola TaxID=2884874 RepID=UPI0021139242|nr:hypothetical protein [Thermomonas paludicola]